MSAETFMSAVCGMRPSGYGLPTQALDGETGETALLLYICKADELLMERPVCGVWCHTCWPLCQCCHPNLGEAMPALLLPMLLKPVQSCQEFKVVSGH